MNFRVTPKFLHYFFLICILQEQFLQSREDEYALGKSYLAKMMNLEAESMTDQDVKGALAYLFPSGLFDPAARPKLLEPDDLYETADVLSITSCGRPKHFMYYTGKAEYFSMMHVIFVHVPFKYLGPVSETFTVNRVVDYFAGCKIFYRGRFIYDHFTAQ